MSDVIEPWHVERVEMEIKPSEYTQRVILKSGEVVSRTMKRTGPGSWRGTEQASVFEDRFDEDAYYALDDGFDGSEVANWMFDPEWSEEEPTNDD